MAGRATDLLLLFRSVDGSTAEGRAKERQRRIALSALASALAKVISVSTALISVPLTLHYLGAERYGMWMTMSSLVAMLGFADLGIGNGLLTSVASAHGRDDRAEIRAYVSSGYCVLSLIALVVIALFCLSYPLVDWFRIFNVKTEIAREEAGPALAALVCCFALAIPLGVVQKVQMGLQRGFVASLWQCGASLSALAGVLLAIGLQASLPLLVLAYVGLPLVAGALNSVVFFAIGHRDIAPSPKNVAIRATRTIAGTGVLYLTLQIVGALAYSTDSIVIAQFFGAPAVAQYAVPEKLFNLIGTVVVMALSPLWPAYAEAITCGDGVWVRRTFNRSIVLALGFSLALASLFALCGHTIISLWVGPSVVSSFGLLCALGSRKVIDSIANAVGFFLNGSRMMGVQIVAAAATALLCLGLKIMAARSFGIAEVVWASVIPMATIGLIPIVWSARVALARIDADGRRAAPASSVTRPSETRRSDAG